MGPSLKVLTLNCKGLNNVIKAKHLTNYLVKEKPNILFLQKPTKRKVHISYLNQGGSNTNMCLQDHLSPEGLR